MKRNDCATNRRNARVPGNAQNNESVPTRANGGTRGKRKTNEPGFRSIIAHDIVRRCSLVAADVCPDARRAHFRRDVFAHATDTEQSFSLLPDVFSAIF